MKSFIRFGKRIAVPSMVQLRHELRSFVAAEGLREECAAKLGLPAGASWDDIHAGHAAAGV